ncbi:MAG: alpha/beta fold hydrolase [Planctomycetota bacterium]|nr:alpha/beta fold hydrolase [Planctomycetota bacterium]
MLPEYTLAGPAGATPILLIHGFPFDRTQWEPQIAALVTDHRVIALDLRGQGRTPAGDGGYLIEFLVDDVIELLDHLELERVCVCGLSMGGYVALRLVDRHPDRVHGLILCDTRAEADSNEGRVARAGAVRTIREHGMAKLAEGLLPKLFPAGELEADTPAVQRIRTLVERADPEGACHALVAMAARLDLSDRLASIDTPCLVVVGSEDTLTPPDDARAMQAQIPGAELVVIEGAGHVSNLSHPEPFNAALLPFLAAL